MKNKLSFEESMAKLEASVRKLESGNMSLSESLEAFEEAVGLVKQCNEQIDAAERKVKMLVEDADGAMIEKPFEASCDET